MEELKESKWGQPEATVGIRANAQVLLDPRTGDKAGIHSLSGAWAIMTCCQEADQDALKQRGKERPS
jgi:hypothetical protein